MTTSLTNTLLNKLMITWAHKKTIKIMYNEGYDKITFGHCVEGDDSIIGITFKNVD